MTVKEILKITILYLNKTDLLVCIFWNYYKIKERLHFVL